MRILNRTLQDVDTVDHVPRTFPRLGCGLLFPRRAPRRKPQLSFRGGNSVLQSVGYTTAKLIYGNSTARGTIRLFGSIRIDQDHPFWRRDMQRAILPCRSGASEHLSWLGDVRIRPEEMSRCGCVAHHLAHTTYPLTSAVGLRFLVDGYVSNPLPLSAAYT
jgi:hypothetical protein